MERYLEKITKCMQGIHVQVDDETYAVVEGLRAIYAKVEGEERVIVDGACAFQFSGRMYGGEFGVKACPMNHENRLAMNRHFKFTVPQAAGTGLSTYGIEGFQKSGLQMKKQAAVSGRRMAVVTVNFHAPSSESTTPHESMTGALEKAIDECAWQAFLSRRMEGFGFCVQGLNSIEEVSQTLDSGVSMISLDLRKNKRPDEKLKDQSNNFEDHENWLQSYQEGFQLIEQAALLIKKSGRPVDLEICVCTDGGISAEEHVFLANELRCRGIHVTGMTPFRWEKHSGSMVQHGMIARHFGYRLGIRAKEEHMSDCIQAAEKAGILYHISPD